MEELSSKADAEIINSQKLGSGLEVQQGAKVPLEAPSLPEACRCVIEQVARPVTKLDWRRGAEELEADSTRRQGHRRRRRHRRRASKPLFFVLALSLRQQALPFFYAAQGFRWPQPCPWTLEIALKPRLLASKRERDR